MQVKLVTITPEAEKLITYIARVSNPANQFNENIAGLLRYCHREGHVSVFEQAHMTVEIKTTRAISAQLLRHRSFCFQEFSQRYAAVTEKPEVPELRLQDSKNRQSSLPVPPEMEDAIEKLQLEAQWMFDQTQNLYERMLAAGIAKECARGILPMNSPTTIYMTGNIRSWMHYLKLRTGNGTQQEHAEIALAIKDIFCRELPIVADALFGE
ncbi:FAD-dependent thymidylate synthase [Pantoea eucrina]|uniref:FAD-dependent thymidylate synthase n=1 Tax=Pantoea eucrina TaxID=472693 RepID=UPI00080F53F5|nr:FAD-dependent thymidylate synthase [Pantoea eucrina]